MKNNDIVTIKLNSSATLRVRRNKIIATVSGSDTTDVYVEGITLPWHIAGEAMATKTIIDTIWGDED